MEATLVAFSTYGDQVVRMIALSFFPFVDVMHIHLSSYHATAKGTFVAIPSLYQLADGSPTFATVAVSSTFPVWRFVTSETISRVVLAGSALQLLHLLRTNLARWIQFRMITAISAVAVSIAKQSGCLRPFALINSATVKANDTDFVLAVEGGNFRSEIDGTLSGAKVTDFLFPVW
jgi:hypothetical protein